MRSFLVLAMSLLPVCLSSHPFACDSEVFCRWGNKSLLHVVQTSGLYNGSKTFVDMKMKFPEKDVLHNFDQLMQLTSDKPTKDEVREFVHENFSEEDELMEWIPSDWNPTPSFLDQIKDTEYRKFAQEVHILWKKLGRRIRSDSSLSSLIFLERPFIVPGGRFREVYYWDTYWIILGLLRSEMTSTVKGMLENFSNLVDKIGFIPNGNRVYYVRRSQPPLFIPMVNEYYETTRNEAFLSKMLHSLDAEFHFWITNRTVLVEREDHTFKAALYKVDVDGPRPESYDLDFKTSQKFSGKEEKTNFFINVKSATESGWDFSSRWYTTPSVGQLDKLYTQNVIPVDLNAFLCGNAKIMANIHQRLGNTDKAKEYKEWENNFLDVLEHLMWNETLGAWFDYDSVRNEQRTYFFASNVAPLWAECLRDSERTIKADRIVRYLSGSQVLDYPGGVPTSTIESGEQWDFGNAWAPMQEIIITGLRKTGEHDAIKFARSLAAKWVKTNWMGYKLHNKTMFEKYNVTELGQPGGGGGYTVATGFGWTNGVVLHLLSQYGSALSSASASGLVEDEDVMWWPWAFFAFLAMAFIIGLCLVKSRDPAILSTEKYDLHTNLRYGRLSQDDEGDDEDEEDEEKWS